MNNFAAELSKPLTTKCEADILSEAQVKPNSDWPI